MKSSIRSARPMFALFTSLLLCSTLGAGSALARDVSGLKDLQGSKNPINPQLLCKGERKKLADSMYAHYSQARALCQSIKNQSGIQASCDQGVPSLSAAWLSCENSSNGVPLQGGSGIITR